MVKFFSLIKFLIKNGADVTGKDRYGNTPLFQAIEGGYLGIVKLLIEEGANPDTDAKSRYGRIPIVNSKILDLLLSKGADVNAKDKNGFPRITLEIIRDCPKNIKVLLKHGADLNAKDKDGNTPLMTAVKNKSTNALKILLTGNNPGGVKDVLKMGIKNNNIVWVKLAMKYGANPTAADKKAAKGVVNTFLKNKFKIRTLQDLAKIKLGKSPKSAEVKSKSKSKSKSPEIYYTDVRKNMRKRG